MSQFVYVKPREGLVILMPGGAELPREGAVVEKNAYWVRRLRDGDVSMSTNANAVRSK